MEAHVGKCIEQMLATFEKVHQEVRRELLNLFENCLDINRKMAL
jgi:hypothetical protein